MKAFTQTPNERKKYVVSFANWLDAAAVCTSATITPLPNGLTVGAPTVTQDGLGIQFTVEGGVSNTTYLLELLMTASDAQKKEVALQIQVRDLA